MKQCYELLKAPLIYIFNTLIATGTFSNLLKPAKVTLILKEVDLLEASNFRPISILPCFSKILERLIYTHLVWQTILSSV